MILLATALFMLLGASAIAVDLAAMRADRSIDQKVTDSAAAAGSLAAFSVDGVEACKTALAYVAINANAIAELDDEIEECVSKFLAGCKPAMAEFYTFTTGRFTITVTYPVPDGHPMMKSGILGAKSQPLVPSDGDPCERVGVEMSAIHQGVFSQLLGFDQGTTTVRTVATAFLPDEGGVPLNLLVLDRFGCQAILVQGNGGVSVNAVINEAGTGLIQGIAASDSDGSAGCTADGVIDIDGSNGVLRADGPAGCANQIGLPVTVGGFPSGLGCGAIQVLAPGTPGCNLPACSPGAGGANPPNPLPTALPGRLTRAPIDHRYNCWGNYASPPAGVIWAVDALTAPEQDIPGCTDGTAANIYDLINTVGESGKVGGVAWVADLGNDCTVLADENVTVAPFGPHIFVDCEDFNIQGDVAINSRDVIFDGNVHVSSHGSLEIQNPAGNPGWVFFRDGVFKKDGQASLSIQHMAVYLSKRSWIDISGGSDGALSWIAPNSGPFDDLALWSDSPKTHFWAGQGQLQMEGVFFTPWALADYSGTSGQNQTEAQWVAYRLVARGQGLLAIKPEFGRAVTFNFDPRTTLIR